MLRTIKSGPFVTQSPSGAGDGGMARATPVAVAAGSSSALPTEITSASTLLDTASSSSVSGILTDPVWGEPSFASLWDDAASDTFVFRLDTAGGDEFSDFHAGDRLDLGWGAPDAGSTLTLVIGPTFTGAGQLIIHANGNQTYFESNPLTSGDGEVGVTGAAITGSDGGGGDC